MPAPITTARAVAGSTRAAPDWSSTTSPRGRGWRGPLIYHRTRTLTRGDDEADGEMSAERYAAMLAVALEEARTGLDEGGIPIGSALFDATGTLLGRGHNRRVQHDDAS